MKEKTAFTEGYYTNYHAKPWIIWKIERFLAKLVHQEFPSKHLKKLIDSLPRWATVLDVGCGTGTNLAAIQNIRPDLSLTWIDIGELENFWKEKKWITFINWDFFNWSFTKKFDFIFSCYTIEHLLNADEFIKYIYIT